MLDRTEEIASIHLGKKSEYCDKYSPSLLVAIPRIENRQQYNIENSSLPFLGFDVWHAYEFSCLTENGIPVTRVLKLKYNCNSEYLVESKSLKLYLNSYNMSSFGKTINDALSICKNLIEKDLSDKLKTKVEVEFLDNNYSKVEIFNNYKNIMDFVEETDLKIKTFKEAPELLKTTEKTLQEYFLTFDSLRSNCRVTHQPDFGDIFIYYQSKKQIEEASLIEYLTSFRTEYHFHEECCEMIFKRLQDVLEPKDKLFVCALYTRRGGIDICPARWSHNFDYSSVLPLLDLKIFARNGIKQ